jgi:hypothetical protein
MDTDEMLRTIDELRQIPVALAAALQLAKQYGLPTDKRADLLFGTGRMTVVLRQVADEIEQMMRRFEQGEEAREPD